MARGVETSDSETDRSVPMIVLFRLADSAVFHRRSSACVRYRRHCLSRRVEL